MIMPPDQRLMALTASLSDGTQIINELAQARNMLVKDNMALRVKLVQVLEHLQVSRAHAVELAKELEKYRKL